MKLFTQNLLTLGSNPSFNVTKFPKYHHAAFKLSSVRIIAGLDTQRISSIP